MATVKQKIAVLKQIYSQPKNTLTLLLISAILYLINTAIIEWRNIHLIKTLGISLLSGAYYSVTKLTFYTSLASALLTGMLLSLLIYRSKLLPKENGQGGIASFAVFLGILAPGCVSCGIGLAATLGLGAALVTLPFKGLELAVLAIILLIYAINKTTTRFIECSSPVKTWKENGKRS
jgi:hypothetical protein